ncbi:MAG: hypothetical protein OQK12_17310 [Motiliproteus sp.]|nr:hypothetical protein [Motiliproteus sp.]MCW9051225.1 hypothetical protein [Motiliproteus sp.]
MFGLLLTGSKFFDALKYPNSTIGIPMSSRPLSLLKLLFLATLVISSPAALSDGKIEALDSNTSSLNLSVENLPVEDGNKADLDQTPLLSDTERQAIENLKIKPEEKKTVQLPQKTAESSTDIGASLITEESQMDPQDPIGSGKNYLDSVDGAKVDMKLKF